jgi:arabinose-5-phosphate isomerase
MQDVVERLWVNQRNYLNYFFDKIELQQLEQMLKILLECPGLILLSGIGKSGLVAEKMSVTLTSTGTRALFISPTNALHGDIGIVSKDDVFIMVSKSGESDELIHLIPYLRNKEAKILSIVSNPNSRLAKACDFFLNIPVEKEICPYNLAPTTSTVMQMIVADILAISLMEIKKFSKEQFAMNHPSGRIGRRLMTKVKDLMLKDQAIPCCQPQDKLADVLVELSNKRCGCVLVLSPEQKLQGIFTDGDLRRTLQKLGAHALDANMEDIMTKSPRKIALTELAWTALQKMEEDQKHPIMVLAVVDESEKVVGIIKMHDIIQSGI